MEGYKSREGISGLVQNGNSASLYRLAEFPFCTNPIYSLLRSIHHDHVLALGVAHPEQDFVRRSHAA